MEIFWGIAARLMLKRIKNFAKFNLQNKYRCNHIAFIFKGKKILAIGRNSNKTHPKINFHEYHEFSRLHAELSACIRFGKEDCRKYSLAVLRIDRNGEFNQSKPCPGCQSVIRQLNFKKVFYTNEYGEWKIL